MASTTAKTRPSTIFGASVEVVLDNCGRVRNVRDRSGASADVSACLRDALEGLRFPRPASFSVCPEFAVAE